MSAKSLSFSLLDVVILIVAVMNRIAAMAIIAVIIALAVTVMIV